MGPDIKAVAKAANLTAEEIARISGHSSRVGAAQDMVRYNVDLVGAMQGNIIRTDAAGKRCPCITVLRIATGPPSLSHGATVPRVWIMARKRPLLCGCVM